MDQSAGPSLQTRAASKRTNSTAARRRDQDYQEPRFPRGTLAILALVALLGAGVILIVAGLV